ncbi:hypothetical protein [Myxosarcina sp. GI1(2024)]
MPANKTSKQPDETPKQLAQPLPVSRAMTLREEIDRHLSHRPKKTPLELEREAEAKRKKQIAEEFSDELIDIISTYILNLRAKELSACVNILVEALYTLEKSGCDISKISTGTSLKDRLHSWLQQEDRLNFGMALLVRAGLVERG